MAFTTIKVMAHARDCFAMNVSTDEGTEYSYTGYVPDIIQNGGVSTSDDLEYKIDLATGQILNWVPPSQEDLQEFVHKCCTED